MNQKNISGLKKWFDDYVNGYYTDDPAVNRAIKLKKDHTLRVCRNIKMLGNKLNISEKDMMFAEVIALLHDIGRFEQFAVYGTFKDATSVNHARLGLKVIEQHHLLSTCDHREQEIAIAAVAHHNAIALPKDKNDSSLFFMKLIRDADKLDIWKVVTDYYSNQDRGRNKTLELDLSVDPEYSPEVLLALNEKKIIRMEKLKTLNDFKLLQLSWVYDLNFSFSFETLLEHGYIDRIAASLPQTDEIVSMVRQVLKHAAAHQRP
ncbi:MAG: HD domain-containing protein [Dissulfuribacterales bacterium]